MKRVTWTMVVVGGLASLTPGMTFVGVLWLLLLVPVVMLVLRFCWWMIVEDARETQRSKRVQSAETAPEAAAIPRGWTVDEYVRDGLRCLQIHLIQSARGTSH
ncbi:MAG: hypothetical protein ACXVW2_05475 [Nocardioidaceae bacterium]